MGIFDVPTALLIEETAKELAKTIKTPEFTTYVKSGAHRERTPNREDWFFVRSASILYQLYKNGASGTENLRTYYGGRKSRGVKPAKKRKASGKVIRTCLQELEKHGFLKKGKKGRVVAPKGEKLLYTKAKELGAVVKEKKDIKEAEKKQRLERAANRKNAAEKAGEAKKAAAEQAPAKTEGKDGHARAEAKKA